MDGGVPCGESRPWGWSACRRIHCGYMLGEGRVSIDVRRLSWTPVAMNVVVFDGLPLSQLHSHRVKEGDAFFGSPRRNC